MYDLFLQKTSRVRLKTKMLVLFPVDFNDVVSPEMYRTISTVLKY